MSNTQEEKKSEVQSKIMRFIIDKKKASDEFGKYSYEYLSIQQEYARYLMANRPDTSGLALQDLKDVYDHLEGEDSRNSLKTSLLLIQYFFNSNDLISAKEWAEKYLEKAEASLGKTDSLTVDILEWYVTVLFEMEEDDKALELDKEFLQRVSACYGSGSPESFLARRNHGDMLTVAGRWEEAMDVFLALEHAEESIGYVDELLQLCIFRCATQLNMYSEQRKAAEKHIINLNALGAESIDIANAYSTLLDGFYATKQYESALDCGRKLIPILQEMGNDGRKSLASVLQTTALICCKTGADKDALKYAEKALAVAKKCYKYDYSTLNDFQNAYNLVKSTVSKK